MTPWLPASPMWLLARLTQSNPAALMPASKSAMFFSMSRKSNSAIALRRDSVYRYAAAESPSTEPKLPWPSISG